MTRPAPSAALKVAHGDLVAAHRVEDAAREAFSRDASDEHLRAFIAAVTARRLAEEIFECAAGRRAIR